MANASLESTGKIERFGLEAIPQDLKTNRWGDYFILQFSFAVNSGNFLVPALAVIQGQLSFTWAVLCTTLGASLAFFLVAVMSLPGARYGIPGQYAIRSILGVKGSQYITSPIRTLISIYWFAAQTVGGALILQYLLAEFFSISVPYIYLALFLGLLMSILAVVGFEAVKNFTRMFIPLLIIGIFAMIYVFLAPGSTKLAYVWQSPEANNTLGAFFTYMSLAFAQHVSSLTSSSDLTRYARSQRDGFYGLFLGNTIGYIFVSCFACYSAVSTGNWNAVVTASQETGSFILLLIINVSALIAIINVNLFNSYAGSFSLLNTFPKLGRVKSSILLGIFTVSLSLFPTIVEEAKIYVSALGSLITPVAGVLIADFLLIKKGKINLEILSQSASYQYNQSAVISILVGIILYVIIPESYAPGLATFFISGCLHLWLHRYRRN